jgi:hypothetical protein
VDMHDSGPCGKSCTLHEGWGREYAWLLPRAPPAEGRGVLPERLRGRVADVWCVSMVLFAWAKETPGWLSG